MEKKDFFVKTNLKFLPKITVNLKDIIINADVSEPYEGDYLIIPQVNNQQELPTKGKFLTENVTIKKIPSYRTSNLSGGDTFYIGDDLNGWKNNK